MKTIYFLNAYHLCWSSWPPVQPSTAQYSKVQPTTAQFSSVQPSTIYYTPLQLSTAQLQPRTSQYSQSPLSTLSNLLLYVPFQKPHSLLCLVLIYFRSRTVCGCKLAKRRGYMVELSIHHVDIWPAYFKSPTRNPLVPWIVKSSCEPIIHVWANLQVWPIKFKLFKY